MYHASHRSLPRDLTSAARDHTMVQDQRATRVTTARAIPFCSIHQSWAPLLGQPRPILPWPNLPIIQIKAMIFCRSAETAANCVFFTKKNPSDGRSARALIFIIEFWEQNIIFSVSICLILDVFGYQFDSTIKKLRHVDGKVIRLSGRWMVDNI